MNLARDVPYIDSPLQQIEERIQDAKLKAGKKDNLSEPVESRGNYMSNDRASVYSFESVSTNGRLLDKLGFDSDDDEAWGREMDLLRRNSIASLKSDEGIPQRSVWDNFDLGRSTTVSSRKSTEVGKTATPFNANHKYPGVESRPRDFNKPPMRHPSAKNRIHHHGLLNTPIQSKNDHVKVVFNDGLGDSSRKAEYFRGDGVSRDRIYESKLDAAEQKLDLLDLSGNSTGPQDPSSMLKQLPTIRKKSTKAETQGSEDEKSFIQSDINRKGYVENPENRLQEKDHMFDHQNEKLYGSPVMGRNQKEILGGMRVASATSPEPPKTKSPFRRVASDNQTPAPTSQTLSPRSELSPQERTRIALSLRSVGKNREASYQLKLAADVPNYYEKAMFLYAMALRFGNGVKQNDRQALKWLCRCVLVKLCTSSGKVFEQIRDLEPEEMINFILLELKDVDNIDANKLYESYSKSLNAHNTRQANIAKLQLDFIAASYHEIGNSLIRGWGLAMKHEMKGLMFLTKAASMGYVDSMVRLGDIWCTKSKNRKKNNYKAASWHRLSELFGVKSIGNSWIYKEKYLDSKAKK